ncbi:hypothetical protein F5H01DRAFT_43738 [Linnemannia elongata]|nr:hypothetical protein F5H01DRAFT_43738 [Linnemannia elongata]
MSYLNQDDKWIIGDVDLLSKFDQFKDQSDMRRFSLSLDEIADVSQGSRFCMFLSSEERKLAVTVPPSLIDERWPNLKGIMERVCGGSPSCSYEDFMTLLKKEDNDDELVEYIRGISYSYSHYFRTCNEIPRAINEREGFGFITWPFIQGALSLLNIPTRCFEIPVIGTKERKNHGLDLFVETEEQASIGGWCRSFWRSSDLLGRSITYL